MTVANKDKLALAPKGTPFIELSYNGTYWYMDSDARIQFKIDDHSYFKDGRPYFNGVTYFQPAGDNDCEYRTLTDGDTVKYQYLFSVDTDSNDYSDYDRFLLFDRVEFRELLNELEECYLDVCKSETNKQVN